ncbi:transposable element Tcb1 transposase [Trichonephila clavipes]|nr:transposable element Tcb1 transposase [Trichonephila clavipes]
MTAQWYVYDILQSHVFPLMQRLPGAIFQQDNAQPHTARVSQDCLCPITTLPWPFRSPDLSAIEHIWDHFGRRVSRASHEFERLWNEMSQDSIQNLYASMLDCISSCIRARGGSTGY